MKSALIFVLLLTTPALATTYGYSDLGGSTEINLYIPGFETAGSASPLSYFYIDADELTAHAAVHFNAATFAERYGDVDLSWAFPLTGFDPLTGAFFKNAAEATLTYDLEAANLSISGPGVDGPQSNSALQLIAADGANTFEMFFSPRLVYDGAIQSAAEELDTPEPPTLFLSLGVILAFAFSPAPKLNRHADQENERHVDRELRDGENTPGGILCGY